ncbi:VRR-NUC domain-containing protein [Idiomarina xiamenensis]|uniref:phosphodiesterase I n=1 Tax=Idiomarina xiamenensis 10-D-4 TaxID=740709 RepID=K2JIY9_9GAMM|nr:VRR-NUC domain-containing protein [Idiomarina xiamenensis]EKE83391.1 hypothetical protein A10D4_08217 [Idiomarina xiamenensis 10-D-4]
MKQPAIGDPAQPLSVDYYRDNYRFLLEWVYQHHRPLLDEDMRRDYHRFQALSRDSQCLLVRMLSRKPTLFRRPQLDYPEIDVNNAISELQQLGWLVSGDDFPYQQWLPLLLKSELFDVSHRYQLTTIKSTSKAQLISDLANHFDSLSVAPKSPVHWFALTIAGQFARFQLLFFGNAYQDLTEFTKTALGHVRYEQYTIRDDAVFPDRQALQQYADWQQLKQRWRQADADPQRQIALAQQLLLARPAIGDSLLVVSQSSRISNRIARHLERLQQLDSALQWYQLSQRHPARERQVRILAKQGQLQAAWRLYQKICEDPWNIEEVENLKSVAKQLAKALRQPWSPSRPIAVAEQQLNLPTNSDVEQAVLAHYQQQGWQGIHGENWLPLSLYGLACWDIIFSDQTQAFCHPFQRAPRDLLSQRFYHRRRQLFEQRWQQLQQQPSQVLANMLSHFNDKHGIANDFVVWPRLTATLISTWFNALTPTQWQYIWQYLAFDYRHHRSGFPDLWLLHPQHGIKLIEVKGPGDRLQSHQRRWLARLQAAQLTIQVCYVSWCD